MRRTASSSLLLVALSVVGSLPLAAQVELQAERARVLVPSTSDANAAAGIRVALERNDLFDFAGALTAASHALDRDSTLGVARAARAFQAGGPTARAEFARASADAAHASTVEQLIVRAWAESNAGHGDSAVRVARRAADLVPDDPRVAVWATQFLSDTARVNALRLVTQRFPHYAGGFMWLAYYLTPLGVQSVARANVDEAMHDASIAERLERAQLGIGEGDDSCIRDPVNSELITRGAEPGPGAAEALMAHIDMAADRYDDARPHLDAAMRMTPGTAYVWYLRAQDATVRGDMPAMRAALDSAIVGFSNVNQVFGARRLHAFVALAEGNPQRAASELSRVLADAQAAGARGEEAATHLWMAYLAAATHDSTVAEQHVAAYMAINSSPAGNAPFRIIVYSMIGNGSGARAAYGDYARVNAGSTSPLAPTDQHRYLGLTLLAEKKPADAIAELRQSGGDNPFGALGIIAALRMQGQTAEAGAEYQALLRSHAFTYASAAMPIIRYTMAH